MGGIHWSLKMTSLELEGEAALACFSFFYIVTGVQFFIQETPSNSLKGDRAFYWSCILFIFLSGSSCLDMKFAGIMIHVVYLTDMNIVMEKVIARCPDRNLSLSQRWLLANLN